MSFNSLINRSNLTLQESLISSVTNLNFLTVEERDAAESLALDVIAYKELLASKVIKRDSFSQLNIEQELNEKTLIDYKVKEIFLLENRLLNLIKDYYNKIEVKKLSLIGKTNELRKKASLISGFSNNIKFMIKEDFINLYNIDNTRNNTTPLTVDTVGEVATLPILKRSKISVNKILISKETNGIPGNPETGKNKLIYNLIDENPDTCFEIFKRGSGPLKVKLILDLNKEEIINELVVGKMNVNGTLSFKIKELVYTDSSGRRLNLESLIDKRYQKLELDSYTYSDSLPIKHIPVKANRISITLETNEYSLGVGEKIFMMGIKNLEFYSNRYQESGELSSTVYQTPEGLYSVQGYRNIFPKSSNSYNENFQISLDKGGEYSSLNEGAVILDGKSKELIFNYKLKRENDFIEDTISENYFPVVEKISRNINRNISPVNYSLDNFNEKTLRVIQPKILSRKETGIPLGVVSNPGKNIIQLPYNLNKSNIKRSEIKLQMNNEYWVNQNNESEVEGNGSFYVRENGKEIVVNLSQGVYSAKLSLTPFKASIKKRPEGYYTVINEKFDYDKDEIKVSSLDGTSERATEFLAKEESRFFLKEENIDIDSFEVYYLNNELWIKEDESNYEINTQDGILYYSINLEKERKCIYKYFKEKILNKNEYEIWAKGKDIKGLYFYEDSLNIDEVQQKLKEFSTRSYDVISRSYSERRNISNSPQCFILKHENIIEGSIIIEEDLFGEDVLYKEVDYIDGFTEFLNLNFMENDPAPNIEKNNLGTVSFALVEIPYLEKGFKVKVFKGEKEIGEAFTDGRICTISLESEDLTSKGYSVEYYYLGGQEAILKYSVDYKSGVIYTEEEVVLPENKNISYSIADVHIEYDIYKEITNIKIDNGISVYTEEFLETNNRVKFLWLQRPGSLSLEGLKDYYSPIIYNLNLEMA